MGCGPSSAANTTTARPAGTLQQREPRLAGGNPNNRRVRPPPSWATNEPVSVSQLASKRGTFWETAPQAGGTAAVWDNLRMICETVLNGDLELASTLVQAADLRCPHGDLSLVFDARGRTYEVPRFAYSNPTNLMTDEEASALVARLASAPSRVSQHKGPICQLSLTIRISASGNSSSEQDVKMTTPSDTKVGALMSLLHEKLLFGECDGSAGVAGKANRWAGKGLPPSRQRWMLKGRELNDERANMQEVGADAGFVLQVFIRPETS